MPRLAIGLSGWLLCCFAGLGILLVYSNTPGVAGAANAAAAADPALSLDADRPTLVMYVHPRCPCTLASAESLARLQARHPGRFATRVVFAVPDGMGPDWHRTALWDAAGRLPDCRAVVDAGGVLTAAAGAQTSGTVAMYAPGGRPVFWGGITPGRGHAGDSIGSDALGDFLLGAEHAEQAAVYGCTLLDTCGSPPHSPPATRFPDHD